MSDFIIVLDYGHGGSKSGAVVDSVEEKDLNLITGEMIRKKLKATNPLGKNIRVLLTRDADYDIPISIRYRLINQNHQQKKINLVVSIHHNAATNGSVKGFEVYYSAASVGGKKVAHSIIDHCRKAIVPIRNKGAYTTDWLGRKLAMIHKTVPTSVLVECGYLTNQEDLERVTNQNKREILAQAITNGIIPFLEAEV